ncbi:hypothetical protein [Thermococcus nautili]|uniref:Uncharacterized protein n=1 Tax=Thermococcus nautili TaxID=195522 RepID=U3RGY5_9EURY|nr:hypothetical protein [Thermococcus nautili]AGX15339.1 hypothetical protein TNaP3-25 [Thermococcus nautili]AHL23866.1 hypothetical protein BD01_2279 [Thermococcus nautili]
MNVVVSKDYGRLAEIALYFIAFITIIYALYKLFGLFKDFGGNIEKKLNELKNTLGNLDLNPSDAPEKFKETGKDIVTIITGTLTGKQNTPEYNDAMAHLHYGGHEWEPGSGKVDKAGNIHKYGHVVKPGKTKVFHGGTYTETVVNNMVKCQYAGGEVLTKEDCLARKYGFMTYAQFNAWLEGIKSALKAEGKDPSRMSLDQIVKYGRELEKKKEEWKKQNPDKATPVLDAYNSGAPPGAKPLPLPEADRLNRILFPDHQRKFTPVIGGSLPARGLLPVDNGMCIDIKHGGKLVPCPPVPNPRYILLPKPKLPPEKHILPVPMPRRIIML